MVELAPVIPVKKSGDLCKLTNMTLPFMQARWVGRRNLRLVNTTLNPN